MAEGRGAPDRIKVLIADANSAQRRRIGLALRGKEDITVVGEASNGLQAIEQVERLKPDVLLVDISVSMTGGRDAVQIIRQRCPGVRVLALMALNSPQDLRWALSRGVTGYLARGAVPGDLAAAVHAVNTCGIYLAPRMARSFVNEFVSRQSQSVSGDGDSGLTESELQVLRYIAEGRSNQEIGLALLVGPDVVQKHRSRIMEKLGLHGRGELLRYALRAGLLGRG